MKKKIVRYEPSYYGEVEIAEKGNFVRFKDHVEAVRRLKDEIASLRLALANKH